MNRRFSASTLVSALAGLVVLSGCEDDEEPLCDGSTYCPFVNEICICEAVEDPTEGEEGDEETVDIPDFCDDNGISDDHEHCIEVCTDLGEAWEPRSLHPTLGYSCAHSSAIACPDWHPEDFILGTTGNSRGILLGLLATLSNNPMPLANCDTARIGYSSTSGTYLLSASTDDAAYLAGLRNGDRFVSLNGYSITTYTEMSIALAALWWIDPQTTYTITVLRGGSPVTLTWDIIAV